MNVSVDIWLRGTDFATTEAIEGVAREPSAWTDDDVRLVLEGMLRAMDRKKRPSAEERPVSLRGLSWIVNPYHEGGVLIALEVPTGAAVAGPFHIEKSRLEEMIARVLAPAVPPSAAVH